MRRPIPFLILALLLPWAGWAGPSSAAPLPQAITYVLPPVFSKGPETFALKDDKGDEPEFHMLNDTQDKRTLAAAIIGTVNADPSTNPKLPMKNEIDIKLKSITFTTHPKNVDFLQVSLKTEPKLSDEGLVLPKLVKRADFIAGKTIDYEIPKDEKNVALFALTSSGHLVFHYDSAKNQILINNADAKLDFSSPFAGGGAESVHFTGRGDRVPGELH